mmetsp:Transcript_9023/g.37206  ORF Transcript_9023/g.37206 Transcript_9023/m.37206 type:complete len:345 (+) Transcript_9023:57-1091(+)
MPGDAGGAATRWAILGTGNIAHDMVTALAYVEGAVVVAVGSRTLERAKAFVEENGLSEAKAYGSYAELAACDCDAVYIGSPHGYHHEHALMCIKEGKNVLCEKALTLNARQAREVVEAAKEKGTFFMEAMWTRFLPAVLAIQAELPSIGDVKVVAATFGFKADPSVTRLSTKELGGGALLDIGVYLVNWAGIAFSDKTAEVLSATGSLLPSGVDETVAMTLRYGEGLAHLVCSLAADMPNDLDIIGTEGRIRVHSPFWTPTDFTITRGGKEERRSFPYAETKAGHRFNFVNSVGLQYEARHVQECFAKGLKESHVMPLARSLQVMDLLDDLRARLGVCYDCDKQ